MKITKKIIILLVISILFSSFSLIANAEENNPNTEQINVSNIDSTEPSTSEVITTEPTEPTEEKPETIYAYKKAELNKITIIVDSFFDNNSIKNRNKVVKKLESEYRKYLKSNKKYNQITISYNRNIVKMRRIIINQYKNNFKKVKGISKKGRIIKDFNKQKKLYFKSKNNFKSIKTKYNNVLKYMKNVCIRQNKKEYNKLYLSKKETDKCNNYKKLGKIQNKINNLQYKLYKYKNYYKIIYGNKSYNKFINKILKYNNRLAIRCIKILSSKFNYSRAQVYRTTAGISWWISPNGYDYYDAFKHWTFNGVG